MKRKNFFSVDKTLVAYAIPLVWQEFRTKTCYYAEKVVDEDIADISILLQFFTSIKFDYQKLI